MPPCSRPKPSTRPRQSAAAAPPAPPALPSPPTSRACGAATPSRSAVACGCACAPDMNTHQLSTFVAVVEVGSFTRAAAHLGISQPTVTNRIKTLEQALGTPLLERLPTGVRPTGAGRELLPYAREIVALTDRA